MRGKITPPEFHAPAVGKTLELDEVIDESAASARAMAA